MDKHLVKLGDLVRIRTGKLDANANDPAGTYPFFTCAVEPLCIDTYSYDCECVLVAGNGDLNVKYYKGKFDAYQRTYIIESLDSSKLDTRYLYRFMDRYIDTLRHKSIGGVIKYIKLENLTEPRIPLPPLPEQRRIAAILDQADALRAKRREALAQLDSLTQSIFIEMFGDPKKLFNEGVCVPLSEVVAQGKIVTYGIVQAGPHVENGIPYIRTGDIKSGKILEGQLARTSHEIASSYSRSAISAGDIVMSIRATVGTTALVPKSLDGANLTQGTARISPGESVCSEYLLNYLRNESVQAWIQSHVKGATFREITLGKLRELPVFVPARDLQVKFTTRVSAIGVLNERFHQSFDGLKNLFDALQHRAFRGEL